MIGPYRACFPACHPRPSFFAVQVFAAGASLGVHLLLSTAVGQALRPPCAAVAELSDSAKLGEGAGCIGVYAAVDTRDGRSVAVKTVDRTREGAVPSRQPGVPPQLHALCHLAPLAVVTALTAHCFVLRS